MTGEISLEYIGRRLDDVQRDLQHHRYVADMLVKQFQSLYAEFDAQRAHLHVIDSRLERLDRRLDSIEGTLATILAKLEQPR